MVELILDRITLHNSIRGFDQCDMLSTKSNHDSDIKVIIVPGNPGLIEFYIEFMKSLYDGLGAKYDIIGFSHIGHCGRIEDQFSVEEQIVHKSLCLEYLLQTRYQSNSNNIKFVLIGHSVGSYISLKMLNRYSEKFSFVNQINLFPTFRNLYEGLSPFIKVAIQDGFRSSLANVIHYVPTFVTNQILRIILPTDDMRVALKYKLGYWTAINILYMAYTETEDIVQVDQECRAVFESRITRDLLFIYGTSDPYTPKQFFDDLTSEYPGGAIEYAQDGVPHAFVLSHSELIAQRVSDWLQANPTFKAASN